MHDAEAKPDLEEILNSFEVEKLRPAAVTWYYQLGLLLVAVMMFILPLIYLALTAGVAYWSWLAFTLEPHELQRRFGRENDGIIFFSAILGVILIFFLIKPLFARRAKPPAPLVISPGDEPTLEAFVNRIADAVGAHRPRAIEVDCNVNAAAGFRRGLWSLFTNDLKLVIGLPLAAGMDLQSFGGILAHEFGHFGQGTGMRLTYLIRSINAWFARVVYERDAWDERLASWSRSVDLRLMIFLMATRLFIWLSRKVLWVLMHVGHGISCFAMRQMEYDADSYEVQFAGSEKFSATSRQLQFLGLGSNRAHQLLGDSWEHRQLARNLPRLGLVQARSIPREIREAIDKAAAEGKTGIFDTHPCDTDRIAAAERLDLPAIFHLKSPSTCLFRDFESLAERATRHYYEITLELPVKEENLIDNTLIEGDAAAAQEAFEALDRFCFDGISLKHPIFVTPSDLQMAPDVTDADLTRLRDLLKAGKETKEETIKALEEAGENLDNTLRAKELLIAGFKIKGAEFGLNRNDLETAKKAESDARARIEEMTKELANFDDLAKRRLVCGLEAHRVAHRDATDVQRLAGVLEIIGEVFPILEDLRELVVRQSILFLNLSAENSEGHIARMRANGADMDLKVKKVRSQLRGHSYPFKHPKGRLNLEELIASDPDPEADAIFNRQSAADKCVNQLLPLYFRALGRLAQLADEMTPNEPNRVESSTEQG